MLVLKTLALEPMHGYGISVRIEQMSNGVFRPNAGSLISCDSAITEGWANRWGMEANGKQQASEVLRCDAEGTKETQ
jgi:PadR family transcriptional regulator, regulatory protein PadR